MSDTKIMPAPTSPPLRARKAPRFIAFGVLIAALVAGAAVVRYQFGPAAEDPLHGDADQAPFAMASALTKTPEAEREAQLQRYANDPSPGLRYAAVDHMADSKHSKRADALERAYTDSSSLVRQTALHSLFDSDPERGLRLYIAALKDEDYWMRDAAIAQLKVRMLKKDKKPDTRIIPALIGSLDDSVPIVPSVAVNILQRMTGNPWQYNNRAAPAERIAVHAKWKAWWQTEKAKGTIPMDFAGIAAIKPTRTDPAPDFSLTDIDNHPLTLAGQKGKVTLLNFWGTWCAPCQQEIPDLVKLDREYRGKGVDVVGIALNEDSADSLRKWCANHQIAYRQVLAVESLQHAYGDIHEVPISVLIDAQGNIRRRWEGERDYNTFAAAVEDVLKPRP